MRVLLVLQCMLLCCTCTTQEADAFVGVTSKVVREKWFAIRTTPFISRPEHQERSSATVTSAAAAPAALGIVQVASTQAPSLASIGLACLVPTLSGYYKSEYGVSYAYGTAMAATAWLVLRKLSSWNSIAGVHALALLVYGIRLNVFLLYRELCIPYFQEVRERIEERAKSRGSRLTRTPFILSCAFLYVCMAVPMLATSSSASLTGSAPFFSAVGDLKTRAIRFLIGWTWIAFFIAMLGDFTKTYFKSTRSSDYLVTEGIMAFLRHPNYTGEFFGWTASALAGILSRGCTVGGILATVVGAAGIDFVLMQAATNLEKKQKEKYGENRRYQKWIESSWAGFLLKKNSIDEASSADAGNNDAGNSDEESRQN